MAESEARVNLFLEDIDHDAIDKRNAIEAEVDQYIRSRLSEREARDAKRAQEAVGERRNRLAIEANKTYAAAHNRAKLALSRRRIEMEQEVFSRAREALCAFASGPDYLPFLERSAAALAAAVPGEAVLLVRPQDLPHADALRTAFGRPCTVEEDPSIEIGGCRARDLTNGLVADDTLEVRLAAQKEWFLAHAKLPIDDREEEVG